MLRFHLAMTALMLCSFALGCSGSDSNSDASTDVLDSTGTDGNNDLASEPDGPAFDLQPDGLDARQDQNDQQSQDSLTDLPSDNSLTDQVADATPDELSDAEIGSDTLPDSLTDSLEDSATDTAPGDIGETDQSAGCTADDDCPAGYSCIDQECVPGVIPPDPCEVDELEPLLLDPDQLGPSSGTINWIEVDPSDAERLYLSLGGELVRSLDGGFTWETLTIDEPHNALARLAIDPKDGTRLYLIAVEYGQSKLLRSEDGGGNWTLLPFPTEVALESVVVDPLEEGVIWVGTHWQGVYRSIDGGQNWQQTGLEAGIVLHLTFEPGKTGRIAAGTRGDGGVYLSQDGGQSWTEAGPPATNVQDLIFDPVRPGSLYALIHKDVKDEALWYTSDYGENWSQILHSSQMDDLAFFALLRDPCEYTRVHVGLAHGIARSTDDGQNWEHVTYGFQAAKNVPILNLAWMPGRILAATEQCGLYSTGDWGKTWYHVAEAYCKNGFGF